MLDLPLLLAAVSANSPCGEDLEYDAQFLQLERDAQGKPERSMGDSIQPAEPPAWRVIEQSSTALLQRSKDLRITHFLTQSSLALEGFSGLRDALELIHQLLQQYWGELYPLLDADDDNDPTVRVNALSGLACEESLSPDELSGALRDTDPDELQAVRNAITEARTTLDAIESYVSEQVGSAQGVDLSALRQPLKLALQVLAEYAPGGAVPASDSSDSSDEDAGYASAEVPAVAAPRASGEIGNRDDVLRSLDRILAYYTRHEPSSPLPVLLNRAKNLVHADFEAIVRNLIPDGMSQFENLRGPEGE